MKENLTAWNLIHQDSQSSLSPPKHSNITNFQTNFTIEEQNFYHHKFLKHINNSKLRFPSQRKLNKSVNKENCLSLINQLDSSHQYICQIKPEQDNQEVQERFRRIKELMKKNYSIKKVVEMNFDSIPIQDCKIVMSPKIQPLRSHNYNKVYSNKCLNIDRQRK